MKHLGPILLAAALLPAQTPLKVLSSNGVHGALEKMAIEKAVGGPVNFQYGTTAALRAAIERGDAFDVAILTTEVIDQFGKNGKLTADSRVALSRSGVGVGVRKGAKHPDISTSQAMKQTLLNAKSLAYAKEGASRRFLDQMYLKLGITAAIEPKVSLETDSNHAAAKVAAGQAEIIMTLISEIKPVPGIELVGPLPKEFQNYVSFAGAVSPQSKNSAAGVKMLKYIASQTKSFEEVGMERP